MFRLRAATFNYRRAGYNGLVHDHQPLLDTLAQLDERPHVLCLSECTLYDDDHDNPLWTVINALNGLWKDEDFYYPFLSRKIGSKNVPGLLVSARHVKPGRWYRHSAPNTREVHYDMLEATIGGHKLNVVPVHWNGAKSAEFVDQQMHLLAQLGKEPTLAFGDFNCTSSRPGEVTYGDDWAQRMEALGMGLAVLQKGRRLPDGSYKLNTESLNDLIRYGGFRDAGEQADDFTVTTAEHVDGGSGTRIDRIFWSKRFPGYLIPGSYRVLSPIPATASDHKLVVCHMQMGLPVGAGV